MPDLKIEGTTGLRQVKMIHTGFFLAFRDHDHDSAVFGVTEKPEAGREFGYILSWMTVGRAASTTANATFTDIAE